MKRIKVDEAKKIELKILDIFAEFCEKKQLRYYLYAGTLLGAVRHKGFIPWDDDIDVAMPRPDYEKLKKYLNNKTIQGVYELLTWENKKTNYNFIKLVDNRTVVYEKYMDREHAVGIWIDIFPVDGLPDSMFFTRIKCIKLDFLMRLSALTMAELKKGTTRGRRIFKRIFVPIIRKIPIEFLCREINGVFKKYDFDQCRFVGSVSGGISYKGRVAKEVYESTPLEFEGKFYNAPKGWDQLLLQTYGDYMRLPPEDKRIQHEFAAYWKETKA